MNDVKIYAIGDIMPGDNPLYFGIGVRTSRRKRMMNMFENVSFLLKEGDLVIGNLENPLKEKVHNSYKNGQLLGELDFIKDLKSGNIGVVNVANNHALQHGEDVFLKTVEELRKNSIDVIGLYDQEPIIKHIKNTKVALMGISLRPEQFNSNNVYYESRLEKVYSYASAYKSRVDCFILSIHWGEEYMVYPSADQREMAHKLVDSGVNIILGHHPHVLQGIEKYNEGIIAYSLGNFISDMCQEQSKKTEILEFRVNQNNLLKYDVYGCRINEYYQPLLLNNDAKIKEFNDYNDYLHQCISINKDCSVEQYRDEVNKSIQSFRSEYRKFLKENFIKYPIINILQVLYDFVLRKVNNRRRKHDKQNI